MLAKIEKVTNSMAEYGFHEYCQSISEFTLNWYAKDIERSMENSNVDNDLQPITIEQLQKPIIIVLSLNGIATITFFAEVILFKFYSRILPLLEWKLNLKSRNTKPKQWNQTSSTKKLSKKISINI